MPSVIYPNSRLVEVYGSLSGRIVVNGEGRHRAYDLDWSPISGPWSTERRALHAFGQHMLQSLYGTTVEVLLNELQRGLIALDQDPANVNRLERCNESQIREICATLLEGRWSKQQVAELIARWRKLKGGE